MQSIASVEFLAPAAKFTFNTAKMGFVEDELKQLKDVIGNLESRVKQLEGRAGSAVAPLNTEEIRMILIGPPGAGKLPTSLFNVHS